MSSIDDTLLADRINVFRGVKRSEGETAAEKSTPTSSCYVICWVYCFCQKPSANIPTGARRSTEKLCSRAENRSQ